MRKKIILDNKKYYIKDYDNQSLNIEEILNRENIGKCYRMYIFNDEHNLIEKRYVTINEFIELIFIDTHTKVNCDYKLSWLFNSFFLEVELIPAKVIDWGKVPQYTKIQVRNNENDKWQNRYFYKVDNRCIAKYKTYRELPDKFTKFKPVSNENFSFIRLHPDVKLNKNWCA